MTGRSVPEKPTGLRRFRSSMLPAGQRGIEFGREHAEPIARTIAAYRVLFDRAARRPVDLDRWGELAYRQIQLAAPELADEIGGIATGSGRSVVEQAAINARTEILAIAHRIGGGKPASECSTVVKLTVDGTEPVAVQAWDWYAEMADNWLVWQIPHPDGRLTTTLTEYGIVGKIGINRSRVGLLLNILHHEADGETVGVPVHVLARQVLDQSADISQAVRLLTAARVSASSSLTIVAGDDAANAAVSVELNPARVGLVLPDEHGLLLHTNHFLSEPASARDTEIHMNPDTVVRWDLLRRRLSGRRSLTEAEVLHAMNSHFGGDGALCCHPDPTLGADEQFQTLATVTLELATAGLRAVPGGPCTHPVIQPV